MRKRTTSICIDEDVFIISSQKYSSKRQLSSLINNFLKNMIEAENPEIQNLSKEIEELEKDIIKLKSLKAQKETVIKSLQDEEERLTQEEMDRHDKVTEVMLEGLKRSGEAEKLMEELER